MHLPFSNTRYSPDASTNVNLLSSFVADVKCGIYEIKRNNRANAGKVFQIGTVRYDWPMSAHASQAFSIAHGTDSEDLPNAVHGSSPVQKMFQNRTEAMLDQRVLGSGL